MSWQSLWPLGKCGRQMVENLLWMEGEWTTTLFFRAAVGRILWEVVQRSQERWLWKTTLKHNNSPAQWAEHMAWIQQEGPAWLNREMPSSNVKMRHRNGGSRQAVRKEDKDIVRTWQKEVWLKPVWKAKRSKRSWIVMTLWTYTSSRDSPHTEFLLHSLLCQPCTNNTEMDRIISVEKYHCLQKIKKGQFCMRKFSILFKNVLIFCQANWADSSPAADLESSFSCVSWWHNVKSTKACQGGS